MNQVFLLLFLGTFANSLHWQAHLAYSTYVSTLQGNQKTLLDKVKDLLTSVRTKQSDITKESDATVRIAKLQALIVDTRSSVSELVGLGSLPLNDSHWSCSTLQTTDKKQLLSSVSQVAQQTKNVNTILQKNKEKLAHPDGSMQSESALQHASEKFVTDLLSVGTEAHPAPPTLKLSNLAAPDWSIGESSLAYIAQSYSQKNTQIDLCPFESPFVNAGGQCIACVYYFDLSKRECTACKDFSDATHSCLDVKATNKTTGNDTSKNKTQQTHITNPGTAPNIILEGISKNQWMTEYYNNMTSNHQLSDCPTATPFFDGTACINCPNAKPYFDLLYMVCTACPQGTTYFSQVQECQSDSGSIVSQEPSLTKMAAGIFT